MGHPGFFVYKELIFERFSVQIKSPADAGLFVPTLLVYQAQRGLPQFTDLL
jgi:hypothetical protein